MRSAVVTSRFSLPSTVRRKPECLCWPYAGAARVRQARTPAVDCESRHAQANRDAVRADRGADGCRLHGHAGDRIAGHPGSGPPDRLQLRPRSWKHEWPARSDRRDRVPDVVAPAPPVVRHDGQLPDHERRDLQLHGDVENRLDQLQRGGREGDLDQHVGLLQTTFDEHAPEREIDLLRERDHPERQERERVPEPGRRRGSAAGLRDDPEEGHGTDHDDGVDRCHRRSGVGHDNPIDD